MTPEEIELRNKLIIHRTMMIEMSDYANMMKNGRDIAMVDNQVAM